MFKSAFLRLVLVYMAIVFAISLIFSVILYEVSTNSLEQGLRKPGAAVRQIFGPGVYEEFKEQRIKEQKREVIGNIVILNIFTLSVGFVLSYVLARRTLDPIEEALNSQTRFTADVAHELRTPLAVMRTENEVTLNDKKITSKEAKATIQSNLEEVIRLQNLVETMLELANGKGDDIPFGPVNINEAASTVIDRYKTKSKQAGVAITQKISKKHTIIGRDDQIDQIIGILLDNAIKYSPKGSEVALVSSQSGKDIFLRFIDHGSGVSDKDKPYVFDRFYRSESARTRSEASGYGLGLALAKKMTQSNMAKIFIEDTKDGGATFVVKFKNATK